MPIRRSRPLIHVCCYLISAITRRISLIVTTIDQNSIMALEKQQPAVNELEDQPSSSLPVFQGNARFFLGGRLQTSVGPPTNLLAVVAIVVPVGLYFGFCAPRIWHRLSPAIPILVAYLLVLSLSSLFKLTSDPGVLPRGIHAEDEHPASEQETVVYIPYRTNDPLAPTIDLAVKYCTVCNIWRPARASHCRTCDCCIDRLDHHCKWLNVCVGARNYRYFFTFIASSSILALLTSISSFLAVFLWKRDHQASTLDALRSAPVCFALALYCAVGLLYPAALLVFHMSLLCRGMNTREQIIETRLPKEQRHRVRNSNISVRSFLDICFAPKPLSYVRPPKRKQVY
ncbi:palmitoyltransferase erf2 [Myxozyma melibiosi]|uniref:Palmitoyltransferase n=1 Tax=Myxozyma melibiosi TaxID=54550 RepID=A0ABR1F1F8_9ASCO